MKNYLNIFIDKEYPIFLDKYLKTKTLIRLKNVSQFCGCDYTKLYSPLFFYSRFDHSLVVAHMTWHFTKDKVATIAALLHDVGTPCFAHTIDYVLGDYINQESSEKNIIDLMKRDNKLLKCLLEDNINLEDLSDLTRFPILENKSPRLCTDRLDGVLHTAYIWLHTHPLNEIKEVYDDITVLTNEDGKKELGFSNVKTCEKFVSMVLVYAKELQGNRDKYVMKYISEIVKLAITKKLFTLEDLYTKKESEIIRIFSINFKSWELFNESTKLICTNQKPKNFYCSFETKKRNVIPLIKFNNKIERINEVSDVSKNIYDLIEEYEDEKYAYIEEIINVN